MTDFQGPTTLDIYRILMEAMQGLLVSGDDFFDEVYDYCIRVEFQGRGTLHIHVVAWAIIKPGVKLEGRDVDNRWLLISAALALTTFRILYVFCTQNANTTFQYEIQV